MTLMVVMILTLGTLGINGSERPVPSSFSPATPRAQQPVPKAKKPLLRARLFLQYGGNAQSRAAIEKGLTWLAGQQRPDGSWQVAQGQKGYQIAITGLSVLSFLGAGYSHRKENGNPHWKTVQRGLFFLLSKQKPQGQYDGSLYVQGIVARALCEAYGMSGDQRLRVAAQRAIDWIVKAQSPNGGWRYAPRQGGDTSVTIWQLRALHQARVSSLKVPRTTFEAADRYLNSCQAANGGYGYTSNRATPTMTAAGLLGRAYLSWDQWHPTWQKGAQTLKKARNVANKIYHDFTAAEAWMHASEKEREQGFGPIRDRLIRAQKANGTWDHSKDSFKNIGPVFTHCISLLALEAPGRDEWFFAKSAKKKLSQKELEAIWEDLAKEDAPAIRQGHWHLVSSPKQSTPFLEKRMVRKKLDNKDLQKAQAMIADLASPDFDKREKATRELGQLGAQIAPILRKALADRPPLEVRRRMERVLSKVAPKKGSPEELRLLRGIQVLGAIGTKEAKTILQKVATTASLKRVSSQAELEMKKIKDSP